MKITRKQLRKLIMEYVDPKMHRNKDVWKTGPYCDWDPPAITKGERHIKDLTRRIHFAMHGLGSDIGGGTAGRSKNMPMYVTSKVLGAVTGGGTDEDEIIQVFKDIAAFPDSDMGRNIHCVGNVKFDVETPQGVLQWVATEYKNFNNESLIDDLRSEGMMKQKWKDKLNDIIPNFWNAINPQWKWGKGKNWKPKRADPKRMPVRPSDSFELP